MSESLHRPGPSLENILAKSDRDSAGMYDISPECTPEMSMYLESLGVTISEPTEYDVMKGIIKAQELHKSGLIIHDLDMMPFKTRGEIMKDIGSSEPVHVWLPSPLYADPTKILSAESFGSWLGRGYMGQDEVAIRERRGKRSSLEQIIDYATRDSQLPWLSADGGLNLIFGDEGPYFHSSNAHRAAAAKLRREPLGFRRLSIYK